MIDALRNDGPSRAGMQRMARGLKTSFEAAPATGSAARPSSSRLLGKIGMTLLASGALFVVARYATHHGSDRAPDPLAAPVPSVVDAAASAPARAEPLQAPPEATAHATPQPELELQPSSAPPPEQMAEARPAPRARSTHHARAAHVASGKSWSASRDLEPSRTTDSATAGEAPAPVPDPAVESARAAGVTANRDEPSARPVEQPAAQPAASSPLEPAARETKSAAPPPSEAGLLQRAQRLAADRPAEALRMLAEHARVYPNGLLAPEREVLAIQILRAQSRTSEANSRLAAFRRRYPDSVYLERLEQRTQQTR